MMASVSLMALYEDESVEVRYGDGSCLQLSPCGCESVLEKKSPVTSHPLQPNERIRQRTRFVISSYKELMVKALEFRNRFATRPYLPGELIPANNRTHFYIDVLEAEWPAEGSGGVKLTDNGRVTVSSVDGRAFLHLSSSGQEFSVEFLCKASPKISQPLTQEAMTRNTGGHSDIEEIARARTFNMKQSKTAPRIPEGKENRHSEVTGLGSCSNHSKIHQQSPVPGTSQTHLYTWVLQHHSVLSSPAIWHHPLSLAIAFMKSKEEGNTAAGSTEGGRAPEVSSNSQEADVLKRETSCLPGPLPLNCPMPHQHRWNYGNTHSDGEQDLEQHLRTELVKVVWCQGIVYRVIKGLITTVEIYPGDGSVIRSKGAVANYFTHHTAKGIAEQTEEKMYLLSSLPPDVPGQRYSISSVVTRANRILQSYSQTRLSLKLPNTFCCWKEENSLSVLTTIPVLIEEAHIPDTGRFSAFSDGRVHVLFRDGVTLHMMWNFSSQSSDAEGRRAVQFPSVDHQLCGWCQLIMPDGQCHLVQVQSPGLHERYVSAAVRWCQWVNQSQQRRGEPSRNVQVSDPSNDWSVVTELQKIKRFNFLLENGGLLKSNADPDGLSRSSCEGRGSTAGLNEKSISEALERTSKAIKDIEMLLSSRSSDSPNAV